MKKSDYLPFFSLPAIDFSAKVYFGVSHFWNRAKASIGWVNYNEIPVEHKLKTDGRLLLGQLTNDSFIAELFKELSPKGLIVSCTEPYEQAGCASLVPVTKTFLMGDAGIEQHHLPFIDFSAKAEPALVLETVKKMLDAYQAGETIYVHCKAGKSRSPLVVALFLAMIQVRRNYQPIDADAKFWRELLREKIASLSIVRPEIHIDAAKIELGVEVLELYNNEDAEAKKEEIYTQSPEFFAKLTQAREFKALGHFAYNNPQYLADMKELMDRLYEDPLKVLAVLEEPDQSALSLACEKIKKANGDLLVQLATFLTRNRESNLVPVKSELSETELNRLELTKAYQEFNSSLAKYQSSDLIINVARRVQSELFLSTVYDREKIDWLKCTAQFLENPMQNYESYYLKADTAVLADDPTRFKIGKALMNLGAVIFIVTLFVALFITSTLAPSIIIPIAVGALAIIAVGKLVKDSDLENKVRDHSKELADMVMDNVELEGEELEPQVQLV